VNVLIVTGNESLSRSYQNAMRMNGLGPHVLRMAEKAAVLVDQTDVDALVMDVDLADSVGPKVAWAIRAKGHRVPIVGLRDVDGAWDTSDLQDLGFNMILDKPVDAADLVAAVKKLAWLPPAGAQASEGVA
jgi:DNA-binding response OmpR family regulator